MNVIFVQVLNGVYKNEIDTVLKSHNDYLKMCSVFSFGKQSSFMYSKLISPELDAITTMEQMKVFVKKYT